MRGLRLVLPLLFISLTAARAEADAIDGEWCAADGKRLLIQGPEIVTPEGRKVTGVYHRHSFIYEGQAGSAEYGQVIYMDLLSEEEMRLVRVKDGETSAAQLWRRCQVTSQFLPPSRSYLN